MFLVITPYFFSPVYIVTLFQKTPPQFQNVHVSVTSVLVTESVDYTGSIPKEENMSKLGSSPSLSSSTALLVSQISVQGAREGRSGTVKAELSLSSVRIAVSFSVSSFNEGRLWVFERDGARVRSLQSAVWSTLVFASWKLDTANNSNNNKNLIMK